MRLKNPVVTMRNIFFWKNFSKIRVEVGASLDQKITKSLFIFFDLIHFTDTLDPLESSGHRLITNSIEDVC